MAIYTFFMEKVREESYKSAVNKCDSRAHGDKRIHVRRSMLKLFICSAEELPSEPENNRCSQSHHYIICIRDVHEEH